MLNANPSRLNLFYFYNFGDHFIHLYYPDSVQHHGHINDMLLIQFLKKEPY